MIRRVAFFYEDVAMVFILHFPVLFLFHLTFFSSYNFSENCFCKGRWVNIATTSVTPIHLPTPPSTHRKPSMHSHGASKKGCYFSHQNWKQYKQCEEKVK